MTDECAEYVDLELMPYGLERQDFQRPWSENASVADQEIKAATAQRVGHAGGPGFHGLLLGDVADGQADRPPEASFRSWTSAARAPYRKRCSPCAASPRAMSRPRPPPAPVTAADLPEFFDGLWAIAGSFGLT